MSLLTEKALDEDRIVGMLLPEHLARLPLYRKQRRPVCWLCGQKTDFQCIKKTEFQECFHLGNASCSNPLYACLKLQDLIACSPYGAHKRQKYLLVRLTGSASGAPDDETPGAFEKRLQKSKTIWANRESKQGEKQEVLHSLTLAGGRAKQCIALSTQMWGIFGDGNLCETQVRNTKGRSDMEMPWDGWIALLRLNE